MNTRSQKTEARGRRGGSGILSSVRRPPSSAMRAFTLVEIMIVVAILGVVLGIGIPSMFRAMSKEGMRLAVSDVLEACQKARAAAILSGTLVELQILPETREFKVLPGSAAPKTESVLDTPAGIGALQLQQPPPAPAVSLPVSFTAQLADNMHIELLDVNFVELRDADEARVRFFPNGTSDEFSIVIRSDKNEWRKVSLEVITALADMEVIR